MKRLWITWERHRRTREFASAIPGMTLYELILDQAPRFVRYPYLLFKTVLTLLREFPALVIVQNPSVVLALFTTALGKLLRFRVVVDAHNEGIAPFYSSHNCLLPIYALIQRWAVLTVVTNSQLANVVRKNKGHAFVLEDMLPRIWNAETLKLVGESNVVYVCTFEKDEPYVEVIKSAEFVTPGICIYITGRYQKISPDILHRAPPNVIFTGFLPDRDFINLLYSCDAVIDLTYMANCLVCGAYEAVALGKPVILSDTKTLRNYFSRGAVYTENRSRQIAAAISLVVDTKEMLTQEINLLRNELESDWNTKFSQFLSFLDTLR
ncbi:MAG: hypothetical protein PHS86_15825 [Syntrophaceae bacterium]|nr:hypothetical protein [Syntrophaceae bacterium]